eukprot:GHVQ01015397.1.p1 GENE.GHVQ01015397.1~~GHVQ01015397.1.p1  ORF type:complete len:185 (+),score=42.49 GHVQ01015397.1:87-641(+)
MGEGGGGGGGAGGSGGEGAGWDCLLRDFVSQTKLEQQLAMKANRLVGSTEVEIVMVDKFMSLIRSVNDVAIYVIGDMDENELMLLEVITAVYQCLSTITSGQIGKRQILEQLDSVFLMLDEVVDSGVILETDAAVITSRLNMLDGQTSSSGQGNEVTTSETTAFNQALSQARDNLMRNFLTGSG